jgi:hypothetical protein
MSNDRAVIPIGPKGVELRDIDAMFRFAQCYLQSGLAPSSFKTEQQLVIAWAKAAELGLSPLQATDGMAVINNRVGIMGDLALAMVESSGLLEKKRVKYSGAGDTLVCEITLKRKGHEEQSYSFSVAEAKTAGLLDRRAGQGIPPWLAYPKRMTYYRALGFGLRDEFPDILKGTKTVEELQDYPSETITQEAKISASQKRDKELKQSMTPHEEELKAHGTKFVEMKPGPRPTPAEAAEPAFEQDMGKPAEPAFSSQLQEDFPNQIPATDDLDMTPPPSPPEAEAVPPLATDSPAGGAANQNVEPPWKSHVILGVSHVKFHERKVGDLNAAELSIIESQWLPAVRADWDDASDAQRADAAAFEAAIAYQKMVKPW